ncbi:M50 family metallopeptidase [Shouchella shacheensis]|uniref:M50 family metallopeptidase n=1 Tax=Shouchella shacheensis TaxID=1649580 RepID=UPI00073FBC8A|nr:M50 family metallopeptidase [Shouchella shacheensis]
MNKWLSCVSVLRIHPLFWVVLGGGVLTGRFREVLLVFLIVLIHELGHAFAAVALGWNVKKIELLPFGGVAETEEGAATKPIKEELLITLAGPAQHVWLMGLSYFLAGQAFWSQDDHRLFLMHNLTILCFNLIPIFPLDGGRLVQLACHSRWPYKRAMQVASQISFSVLTAAILSLPLLPFHLNLYAVLTFLVISNYLEQRQSKYRFIRFLTARHTLESEAPLQTIPLHGSITVREAVHYLKRSYSHHFTIGHGDKRVVLKESTLLAAYFEGGAMQEPLSTLIDKRKH